MILTLKDTPVLAEDDDTLVNVNMVDDERHKKVRIVRLSMQCVDIFVMVCLLSCPRRISIVDARNQVTTRMKKRTSWQSSRQTSITRFYVNTTKNSKEKNGPASR